MQILKFTLRKDANICYNKEDIKVNKVEIEALKEFFKKYEFFSLLKRLEKKDIKDIAESQSEKVTFHLVVSHLVKKIF